MYDDDDLNLLFDAALEWGENLGRPLIEWTREYWPEWDGATQTTVAAYIDSVRSAIKSYIWDAYKSTDGTVQKVQIMEWIVSQYPWMTTDNAAHAYSQGMFYAWYGG